MLRGVPFQLLEPEVILRVLHPLRHVQILLAVRYHRVLWAASEPSVATAPPLEGWCIVRIPPGNFGESKGMVSRCGCKSC